VFVEQSSSGRLARSDGAREEHDRGGTMVGTETLNRNGARMSTRRQLLDVARGVASSFCSGNNRYQGAWLPGVLLHEQGPDCRLSFSLAQAAAGLGVLSAAGDYAAQARIRITDRLDLPQHWISGGTLTIRYSSREPSWTREVWLSPRRALDRPTWWFSVVTGIVDDRGRTHQGTTSQWCWPDPRPLPVAREYWDPEGRRVRP